MRNKETIKHWYGRWKLWRTRPPNNSNGLVCKHWYALENVIVSSAILDFILCRQPTYRYFIFECIQGSSPEGKYVSRISYWCYDSISKRNEHYHELEELPSSGR